MTPLALVESLNESAPARRTPPGAWPTRKDRADVQKRTCILEGCDRKRFGHGWCQNHYERWKRSGHPLEGRIADPVERFWSRVDQRGPMASPYLGPCWIWTGCRSTDNYGHVSVDGKTRPAHRVSFGYVCGPIPDGLVLDHLCRNPPCVNPAHLEPVTHRENMRRAVRNPWKRSLAYCKRGHPFDEKNTYIEPSGKRRCRTCDRLGLRSGEVVAARRAG